MKKRSKLATLLPVVVMIIATGCGKSSSAPSSISANINGKSWLAQYINGTEAPGSGIITLVGFFTRSGDTSTIALDVLDTIPVNTPDPFFNADIRYTLSNGTTYTALPSPGSHGTITVTILDTSAHRLSGTFSGAFYNPSNSKDSITVTDGRFNSGYTRY
jgi:outer membrane receptor for monomeric catechols